MELYKRKFVEKVELCIQSAQILRLLIEIIK